MTYIDAQDKVLSDALAAMGEPEQQQPERATRKRKAVEPVRPTRPGTYTVETFARETRQGAIAITVDADTPAGAVLASLEVARLNQVPYFAGLVSMWDYRVTDTDGETIYGSEPAMRNALDKARIERANERAAKAWREERGDMSGGTRRTVIE